MSIGIWQIAIVVILVVLLFGRGKISSLMGDVAKGIKSFKKGMASDVTDESEPKNIGLSCLFRKVISLKSCSLIPTNLTGYIYLLALCHYGLGVAFRLFPPFWK